MTRRQPTTVNDTAKPAEAASKARAPVMAPEDKRGAGRARLELG
ncbi:hypothetical protein [Cupriavidus necator]